MDEGAPLQGFLEVRWSVELDDAGVVVGVPDQEGAAHAPACCAACAGLSEVGFVLGLGELTRLTVRAPREAVLLGVRPGRRLLVGVDPGRGINAVEQALVAWCEGRAPTPPPLSRPPPMGSAPTPLPMAVDATAFAGTLSEFSVPELLEFLRGAQRTGALLVGSGAKAALLRFRDGWIIGAALLAMPSTGKLSELWAGRIDALAAENLVGAEASLHDDVRKVLRELVAWGLGEFVFRRDTGSALPLQSLALVDSRHVLFEVFREVDGPPTSRSPVRN